MRICHLQHGAYCPFVPTIHHSSAQQRPRTKQRSTHEDLPHQVQRHISRLDEFKHDRLASSMLVLLEHCRVFANSLMELRWQSLKLLLMVPLLLISLSTQLVFGPVLISLVSLRSCGLTEKVRVSDTPHSGFQ